MGARISYSLMNGILLALLGIFGLFGFINSIIPLAAVTPILIFIGVVMVEVSFTAVPRQHVPAAAVALLPFIGEFAKEQIDSSLSAMGASAANPSVIAALAREGINYPGYLALAHGTIIISMIMAAIVVFIIERRMLKASMTAFGAAVLSAVGLIHSPVLAFLPAPPITIGGAILGIAALAMHLSGVRPENKTVAPKDR
jgi:AGZA family xanthine/uracil permease-like MFS transporter